MNYLELKHIVQRLVFDLLYARFDHVSDGDHRIQFAFRRLIDGDDDRDRRFFLIIDFMPGHLDIYPTDHPRKAPAVPQAFTMLLRKYCSGRSLIGISLAEDDRIVTMTFGTGDMPETALIIELTGRAPNLFFVDDESNEILGMIGCDALRQVHTIYERPAPHDIHAASDRFANVSRDDYYHALDAFFQARDSREWMTDVSTACTKKIRRSLNKCEKKIESLKRDLYKLEMTVQARNEADLLNAYAWKVNKGADAVELPDFETGELVRIALDPSLSVRENIDKRYAQCKRLSKARPMIENRLLDAECRHDALLVLMDSVQAANTMDELSKLSQKIDELCRCDEKAPKPKRVTAQTKNAVHIPYKIFTSADSTKIYVGKSAADNDDLTFHHARGNDWWLHVSGVPGSHVVVKSADPSQETILDAALLAMHYSKEAHAGAAEVHVTQVKYVRKPKGFPPGKVEIRGERSIRVSDDEKRLARLTKTLSP